MNDPVALASLRKVAWLEGLSDPLLDEVARAGRFKRYVARQEVMARGDVDRDCFLVLSGCLAAIAWSASGRQVSFRDIPPGEIVGELSAIDGRPRSATVVALSESLVLRLSPEVLTRLFQNHWPICERMLKHLAAAARDMTDRVYELSMLNVQQRLSAELLRLSLTESAAGDQAILRPMPSHTALASRIGSTRPQVTRELAELERLGLIERIDGELRVSDLRRLAESVESSPNRR